MCTVLLPPGDNPIAVDKHINTNISNAHQAYKVCFHVLYVFPPTHFHTQIDFTIVYPCIVTDSFWIKPTDAPNSNFIGITAVHVSGSLSAHHQEFLAVNGLWYILCSSDDRFVPGARWNYRSILLLVPNGHHNCIKCTKAHVRLRTPDDGQKGCPKHVES